MEKKMPSDKATAIIEGLVLIISFILLNIYLSDLKAPIECMTQDYPSVGLSFISRWIPLLLPVPSAIFLLWKEIPKLRKAIIFLTAMAVLLVIIGIIKVISAEEISWDMFSYTLYLYFGTIVFASIIVCRPTKIWLAKQVDRIL